MANLPKGKDAKPRVYGSNGTMTAWLPKIKLFWVEVIGCSRLRGSLFLVYGRAEGTIKG